MFYPFYEIIECLRTIKIFISLLGLVGIRQLPGDL